MPKEIIDYSKTIIYKIVCNDLNIKDVYIGHTTSFIKRKQQHKKCCLNNGNHITNNTKVYQYMRDHGGWENFSMIEIEKFPCNDKQEAVKQERYWYEQLNAQLNTRNPNRNIKEYRENHKEEIKAKKSLVCICACGVTYTHNHKSRHEKTKKHQDYITQQEI